MTHKANGKVCKDSPYRKDLPRLRGKFDWRIVSNKERRLSGDLLTIPTICITPQTYMRLR